MPGVKGTKSSSGRDLRVVLGCGSSEFQSSAGISTDAEQKTQNGPFYKHQKSALDSNLQLSPTSSSASYHVRGSLVFQEQHFNAENNKYYSTDSNNGTISGELSHSSRTAASKEQENVNEGHHLNRDKSHFTTPRREENTEMPESLQTCYRNNSDSASEDSRTESEKDLSVD